MAANFFNFWDIMIGVLSLGGPSLVAYLYHQLPSKKVIILFDNLEKAEGFLELCMEQGLLSGTLISQFKGRLKQLRDKAIDLRMLVYSAKTWTEDCANMYHGLTRRIRMACWEIVEVNANISIASSAARLRLEAERRVDSTGGDSTDALSQTVQNSATSIPESSMLSATTLPRPAVVVDPIAQSHPFKIDGTGDDNGPSTSERTCSTSNPAATQGHRDAEPALESHGGVQHSSSSLAASSGSGAPSTRAVPRRKQSTPLSRARAMARALRRNRKRRSVQSQASCETYLLDLSGIELVDESDEDWEDATVSSENSTPLVVS